MAVEDQYCNKVKGPNITLIAMYTNGSWRPVLQQS